MGDKNLIWFGQNEIVSEMPSFVNHVHLKSDALKNISSRLCFLYLNTICIICIYERGILGYDIVHVMSDSKFGSANSFKFTVKLMAIIV